MLGAGATLPLRVGGGPTDVEAAYDQLRHAVGEGGSARDDSGIEGLWRWSEAVGLAAASSAERRALLQAIPRFATDLLPYYERVLQIVPPFGSSVASRAAVVSERWYRRAVAATPDILVELAKVDERLVILEPPEAHNSYSHFGRAFEAHVPAEELPAFNMASGHRHAWGPNYSSRQVVRVRFNLGYSGGPTAADKLIIVRVKQLLRLSLPSDTDFRVSIGPWRLGSTPIGLSEVG